MKLKDVLKDCKSICKLDSDDTDFDNLIVSFINDSIDDIYTKIAPLGVTMVPVIDGKATVEEGLRIINVEPNLNINDRVLGNTIITTLKGVLKVTVIEESNTITDPEQDLPVADKYAKIIKYKVASLWFAFKKNIQVSQYWFSLYQNERDIRLENDLLGESYQIPLMPNPELWG